MFLLDMASPSLCWLAPEYAINCLQVGLALKRQLLRILQDGSGKQCLPSRLCS